MSCENISTPINIHNNNILSCTGKCKLNYNYKASEIIATNKRQYIVMDLVNKSPTVLNYTTNTQGTKCNVQGGDFILNELRIYYPSIHTYKNKRADAELIIEHKNVMGGNDLLICIPISISSGTQPAAANQLIRIVDFMADAGNRPGKGGIVKGLNLDLNNFIPKKGFYTYSGSLPYPPCSKCVIFIVYDLNEASINLPYETFKKLKSIIYTKKFIIQKYDKTLGLAYNRLGASRKTASDDSIWIDCQPTGSDGQLLIRENKDPNESNLEYNIKNLFKLMDNKSLNILAGITSVIVTYYIIKYFGKKLDKLEISKNSN